jgi:hypothetical protein
MPPRKRKPLAPTDTNAAVDAELDDSSIVNAKATQIIDALDAQGTDLRSFLSHRCVTPEAIGALCAEEPVRRC